MTNVAGDPGLGQHKLAGRAVVMRILVTSASGANGNGYGAVLAFGLRFRYRKLCRPHLQLARLNGQALVLVP
jgi:hypothetical protein